MAAGQPWWRIRRHGLAHTTWVTYRYTGKERGGDLAARCEVCDTKWLDGITGVVMPGMRTAPKGGTIALERPNRHEIPELSIGATAPV